MDDKFEQFIRLKEIDNIIKEHSLSIKQKDIINLLDNDNVCKSDLIDEINWIYTYNMKLYIEDYILCNADSKSIVEIFSILFKKFHNLNNDLSKFTIKVIEDVLREQLHDKNIEVVDGIINVYKEVYDGKEISRSN